MSGWWWLEPDMTGGRLARIRSARRGGLIAGLVFVPIAVIAGLVRLDLEAWKVVALATVAIPGIVLLGAGLSLAALETRTEALASGAAMAVGVPIAAVVPELVVVTIVGLLRGGAAGAGEAFGAGVRVGIETAFRVEPVVVLGAVLWVVAVRRFARFAPVPVGRRPSPGGSG